MLPVLVVLNLQAVVLLLLVMMLLMLISLKASSHKFSSRTGNPRPYTINTHLAQ
jgi:hypothetical protein